MDSDCNAKSTEPMCFHALKIGRLQKAVIMERKCLYCGTTFVPGRKNQVFCSKKCKDNASKERRGIFPAIDKEKMCPECGDSFITRNSRKVFCSKQCADRNYDRKRYRIDIDTYLRSRREQAEQRAKNKEVEKAFYRSLHTVERECAYCGETFYCCDWEKTKTCSNDCRRKMKNRSRDKRIPAQAIVDTDINVKKLYKRDGGKCYLCGRDCSFDDWNTSASGYKYPGDLYPEIEHVIPISRGGLHSWDNVRLACHKCNHIKSDEIVLIKPMSKAQAYSEKRYGTQPKQTIQMSLDGDVIRIWDSTAQIKRELGLNDKRIQDVCRGQGKTAFGYRWKYA